MNPYIILGVSPDASDEEIKKAYQRKARIAHPDREGGNTEAFQELNAAYSILSNPKRRALYDESGSTEKPKDYMTEANANLAQVFLRMINEQRKGDIVDHVRSQIEDGLSQGKKNRGVVLETIEKFEVWIDRVVSESDTNVCNNIVEHQIINLKKQVTQFDDFIEVSDLMLILLEGYNDTLPDPEETEYYTYSPSPYPVRMRGTTL